MSIDKRLQALEDREANSVPYPGPPVMVDATADGDGYVVTPETDVVMAAAKAAGRLVIVVVSKTDPAAPTAMRA